MRVIGRVATRTKLQALQTYGVLLVVSFCLPSLTLRHATARALSRHGAVSRHAGDVAAVRTAPAPLRQQEPLADVDDEQDELGLASGAGRGSAQRWLAWCGSGEPAARPLEPLVLAPKLGPPQR